MAKKLIKREFPKEMPKNFDMIESIQSDTLYKSNIGRRDSVSRKILERYESAPAASILPGQLISFKYFEPKTKEDLEYYDAMPVTLFFGKIKTKKGEPRVLGWNGHYYPPRIRYQLYARVFEMFKPFYKKAWAEPLQKELSYMEYGAIIYQLQKAKLEFGVRMYIPQLMTNITPIPTQAWPIAAFTEGHFKKTTIQAIRNYWKNKPIDNALISRATKNGLKNS